MENLESVQEIETVNFFGILRYPRLTSVNKKEKLPNRRFDDLALHSVKFKENETSQLHRSCKGNAKIF